jgi:hypothetical protein
MIGRGYRPGGQLGRDLLHRRAKLRLDTGCSSSRSTNRPPTSLPELAGPAPARYPALR